MTDRQLEHDVQGKIFHNWLGDFPYDGFLYGSRRMISSSTLPLTTDWDVAVQGSVFVETHLINDGWSLLATAEYTDSQTTRVYEKHFSGIYVQVALRRDLGLFRDCWRVITDSFYQTFLHKASPSYIGKDNVTSYLESLYASFERGYYSEDSFKIRKLNIRPKSVTKSVRTKINLGAGGRNQLVGWVNAYIDHIQPMLEPAEEPVPDVQPLEWWEDPHAVVPAAQLVQVVAAHAIQGHAF